MAGAWQAYHGGDVSAARTICERLLSADGDDVAALFLAGLIDYGCGDSALAVERLTRVVQLRPAYAEAHNNLGNALAALGQLSKAEQAFREALRRKRQYPEALNNLANTLRDQRRLGEAVDAYRAALQLRPD
ncbi:MAG TPA: tetratricopeptide repeat protein [Pirellulales bacterium]|nr:tetratricopeptide repeat protein [Pirellulales bacterium]